MAGVTESTVEDAALEEGNHIGLPLRDPITVRAEPVVARAAYELLREE